MTHGRPPLFLARTLLAACALHWVGAASNALAWQAQAADPSTAAPQTTAPTSPSSPAAAAPSKKRRIDCPHPADPHRRHMGCKDQDFDWDETLFHNYSDVRSKMRDIGVTPTLSYAGVLQTNVTGKTHQIWSYAGQLTGGLNIDFEKLLKLKGTSLYIGGSWGTGDNLSGSLNNVFPVNSYYAPDYYLGEMYVQQTLLDQNLTLQAGRLAAANTFATLPVFGNYINYGLNPNPYVLGYNDIVFFAPPTGTEWGAQATYNVTSTVQVAAGLFNNNLYSANGQNHGADWTLQQGNKGALVLAQASWYPHGIVTDQGKQGLYTVGIISDNDSFPTLPNQEIRSGGYVGAFVLGQETVYQPDGPNTLRGLNVWGSWAYNAKPLVSPIPVFWAAGASYQGLIPSREQDIASVGWIYGQVSNFIPGTTAEQVFEVNYRWQPRRFLAIAPDFQYIWNPGGYSAPGITVIGIQPSITF